MNDSHSFIELDDKIKKLEYEIKSSLKNKQINDSSPFVLSFGK